MIKAFKEGVKAGFVVGCFVGGFLLSSTVIDKGYSAVKNLVKNYKKPEYMKDDFDEEDKEE